MSLKKKFTNKSIWQFWGVYLKSLVYKDGRIIPEDNIALELVNTIFDHIHFKDDDFKKSLYELEKKSKLNILNEGETTYKNTNNHVDIILSIIGVEIHISDNSRNELKKKIKNIYDHVNTNKEYNIKILFKNIKNDLLLVFCIKSIPNNSWISYFTRKKECNLVVSIYKIQLIN